MISCIPSYAVSELRIMYDFLVSYDMQNIIFIFVTILYITYFFIFHDHILGITIMSIIYALISHFHHHIKVIIIVATILLFPHQNSFMHALLTHHHILGIYYYYY